jgi:hypothetical protein
MYLKWNQVSTHRQEFCFDKYEQYERPASRVNVFATGITLSGRPEVSKRPRRADCSYE